MQLTKLILTSCFVLSAASSGCGNDNGGGGGGGDGGTADMGVIPCTPYTMTNFDTLYTQIFHAETCARSGCHDATEVARNPPGSGDLDLSGDKAAVYAALVNDPTFASDVVGEVPRRIMPNSTEQSFVWRKVHDLDPPGFGSRMPQGCAPRFPQSCLTTCELDAIEAWINAGAMND